VFLKNSVISHGIFSNRLVSRVEVLNVREEKYSNAEIQLNCKKLLSMPIQLFDSLLNYVVL